MTNKIMRGLSILLVLALLIGCFPTLAGVRAAAAEPTPDYYSLSSYEVLQGDGSDFKKSADTAIEMKRLPGQTDSSRLRLKLEELFPDQNVQKISYQYLREEYRTYEMQKLIYAYQDENNYSYLRLHHWDDTLGFVGWLITWKDGAEVGTQLIQLESQYGVDASSTLDVSFDYTAEGIVGIRIAQGSKVYESNTETTYPTAFVIETQPESGSVTYSNIQVAAIAPADEAIAVKTIKNFQTRHKSLLSLSVDFVTVNYKAPVQAALEHYATQNAYVKSMLSAEFAQLKALEAAIAEMEMSGAIAASERDPADYSDWTENFENGLGNWATSNSAMEVALLEKDGSTALKIPASAGKEGKDLALYPKAYTMPDKGFVYEFSYDLWLDGTFVDVTWPLDLFTSYVDKDNWQAVQIFRFEDNEKLSYKIKLMKDGVDSDPSQNLHCIDLDFFGGPLRVIVKRDESGSGTMTLKDHTGKTYTVSFSTRGQNGTAALAAGNLQLTPTYDNLTVKMREGQWEEDVTVDKITVYYAGNTELHGDDVVSLIGDNLYETVSSIQVAQIQNSYSADSTLFVNACTYDREGVSSTCFTGKQGTYLWENYVDKASAQAVSVVQSTADSVKFILPADLPTGQYAVKLSGFDFASENDDVVVILNDAYLKYYLGSDGRTAAAGSVLRLVGENLCLGFADTDTRDYIPDEQIIQGTYSLKAKIMGKNGYRKIIDSVEPQSNYSLSVTLPHDIPAGDYEIAVYNGYGVGWSTPLTFTVKASPMDSWSKEVFNIQDFGATGDRDQNATPYFVDAMTALAENGGGILYIPKGIYTLIHSIVVPENVQMIGEGVDRSVIIWNPEQWGVGKCPPYLLGLTSNVAISDIAFYMTRTADVIKSYGDSVNIYINNIRTHWNPVAGNPTGGTTTAGGTGKYTETEQQLIITNEMMNYNGTRGSAVIRIVGKENIRIDNLDFHSEGLTNGHFNIAGDYLYYGNSNVIDGNWCSIHGNNIILEYNRHTQSGIGINGYNEYLHGNSFESNPHNNRELFVYDGSPLSHNGIGGNGILVKDSSDPTGCTYILNNFARPDDLMIDWAIYVVSGQGMLQTRKIVDNAALPNGQTKIIVDSPFVVEPNANSRVSIREMRNNNYYVSNRFYDGLAGGYFGGFTNVVYDSNLHERHTDFYQMARDTDVNWYLTYNNERFEDAFNIHNYGSGSYNDFTGYGIMRFWGDSFASASVGITLRGCESDGYHIDMSGYMTYSLSCYTFDKNAFSNSEYMVYIGGAVSESADGVYFYKNITENVDDLVITKGSAGNNIVGSKTLIVYSEEDGSDPITLIGDVDGNGVIEAHDAELIRLYVSGQAELTKQQLAVANYWDDDGVIDLKDATAILYFLEHGVHPKEDNITNPNLYFPGYY